MPQPIPRRIKEKDPSLGQVCFNTLLVDGSNLLEIAFSADKKLNSDGVEIGGIYQFLLQLKQLMKMGNFRYVYVFWDGSDSGIYRSEIYREYKANRDKSYSDDGLSDYMSQTLERKAETLQPTRWPTLWLAETLRQTRWAGWMQAVCQARVTTLST